MCLSYSRQSCILGDHLQQTLQQLHILCAVIAQVLLRSVVVHGATIAGMPAHHLHMVRQRCDRIRLGVGQGDWRLAPHDAWPPEQLPEGACDTTSK